MSSRVLLVQSETEAAATLARFLEDRGDETWQTQNLEEAVALLDLVTPDILFLDLHFPQHHLLSFLRQIRQSNPNLKVVITNKTPDVQREFQVQNLGVKVFLRQPFTRKWLDRALERLQHPTTAEPLTIPDLKVVKLPFFLKVFLPYLLLGILLLVAGIALCGQLFKEADRRWTQKEAISEQQFLAHLVSTEQESLLAVLHAIGETPEIYTLIEQGDTEALVELVEPVFADSTVDALEFLDAKGIALFSLRTDPESGSHEMILESGEVYFTAVEFVKRIRFGLPAETLTEEAGLVSAPWGDYFYTAQPLQRDGNLVGILLVGKSLYSLGEEFRSILGDEINFYDGTGHFIYSTMKAHAEELDLSFALLRSALNASPEAPVGRLITINNKKYLEMVLVVKSPTGEKIALSGALRPYTQTTILQSERVSWLMLLIVLYALLAAVFAWVLAKRVKDFSHRYSQLTLEIADGNLGIKMENRAGDELSQLSGYVNYMVAGLQERLIERDLLGIPGKHLKEKRAMQFQSIQNAQLEGRENAVIVLRIQPVDFLGEVDSSKTNTAFCALSEFYQQAVEVASHTGNAVFYFEGEALMIYFGLVEHTAMTAEDSLQVCQAAQKMHKMLAVFNSERHDHDLRPLILNFYIDQGMLAAGVIHVNGRLIFGASAAWLDELRTTALSNRAEQNAVWVSTGIYESLAELREQFIFAEEQIESNQGVFLKKIYRLN